IARARGPPPTGRSLQDILEWSVREEIRCLYLLASSNSSETTDLAGANGFRMADLRFTLARGAEGDAGSAESVRAFHESDLPYLQEIAAISHRDSRFYH